MTFVPARPASAYLALVTVGTVAVYAMSANAPPLPLAHGEIPASALMFLIPAAAALLLTATGGGLLGVRGFMAKALVIASPTWAYALAILLMPAIVASSLLVAASGRVHLGLTPWEVSASAVAFGAAAVSEELGWSGYLLPALRRHVGATASGLTIGVFWAVWHVAPYRQAGHDWNWIAAQAAFTVGFRMVLVRLCDLGGGGVLLPSLSHASYNTAWSCWPVAVTFRPGLLAAGVWLAVLLAAVFRPAKAVGARAHC